MLVLAKKLLCLKNLYSYNVQKTKSKYSLKCKQKSKYWHKEIKIQIIILKQSYSRLCEQHQYFIKVASLIPKKYF